MVNKGLIKHYCWGGTLGGDRLASHDKIVLEMNIDSDFQVLCSIRGGGRQTFGTQVMQGFKCQGWT